MKNKKRICTGSIFIHPYQGAVYSLLQNSLRYFLLLLQNIYTSNLNILLKKLVSVKGSKCTYFMEGEISERFVADLSSEVNVQIRMCKEK